jgi:2-oxoglutarate ferredoxin oxidoreductase subunit beta
MKTVTLTEFNQNPSRVARLAAEEDVLVHDVHNPDPATAFALSRLTDAGVLHRAPIGIFRDVERPTYDDQARAQVSAATATLAGRAERTAALADLIGGGDTWTVL